MKTPLFKLNENLLDLCSEIARLLGRYEGLSGAKPQPLLRKLNRIRTIQGSLAIEGNTLSVVQVTALLDGKRVVGPKKEILEVQNASAAYEQSMSYDPHSIRSLLQAHGILMRELIPDAGKWRAHAVGIIKGTQVSHLAPKAQYVQGMVKELLAWTQGAKTNPLIASSVFHHQFELIHPFSDGNGRMGRLWQNVLLTRFHPVFEFVPVESIIRDRQEEYYRALEKSDRTDDSTPFVEFMLAAILAGTQEFLGALRVEKASVADRLQSAKEQFQNTWFSRKEYQTLPIRLSAPTASRDLKFGVDQGTLERKGDKAQARYKFR